MSTVKKIIFIASFVLVFGLCTEVMVRKRMGLIDVVVVNKDLGQRHQITENDLTTIKTSRHLVPDDALLSKKELTGQYVKMEHTLLENQVVRKKNVEKLSEAIDAPQLLLYKDQRVYALKKDVVGTAGASLQTGSFVDVALQHKRDEEYGIIIENVRVVGVKDRNGKSVGEESVPHVILLAIEADDVNALLQAEEEGKIVLLPRDLSNES